MYTLVHKHLTSLSKADARYKLGNGLDVREMPCLKKWSSFAHSSFRQAGQMFMHASVCVSVCVFVSVSVSVYLACKSAHWQRCATQVDFHTLA